MSLLKIKNVRIVGVSACVPENTKDNYDYDLLSKDELKKYIETTGIRYRHVSKACSSDLCLMAAETLIAELNWDKKDIEALVFVSQTPDYKMPSTSCLLQHKLGLSPSTLTFDISLGCSGFVYGLSVISSVISASGIRKALLLVGNTQSKNINRKDKSSYLLFSDAGTATALEFDDRNSEPMYFNLQTYGEGWNSIIIPDGMYRNPITESSFIEKKDAEGNIRNSIQLKMDGMEVFSFVINKVPKCINELMEYTNLSDEKIDFYMLHHANKYLMDKLRKKLKFSEEKTPYNIQEFGNSSGACVPLLMVTNCRDELRTGENRILFTGFGVGLSLGAAVITTKNLVIPELQFFREEIN